MARGREGESAREGSDKSAAATNNNWYYTSTSNSNRHSHSTICNASTAMRRETDT